MGYLYRHIRLDKNEVFYIGIGGFNKNEETNSYKRAYAKTNRNKYWKHIVDKTEYIVEIIYDNINFNQACGKEREYIKLYGRKNLGLGTLCNLTDGGDGSSGLLLTEEHKRKISESVKGYKHTKETKEKLSILKKGKVSNRKGEILSEETKNKISESNKGKKRTQKFINNLIGRKLSIKTIQKISEANKGRKMSETTKQKLCESHYKKIICLDNNIIYNSIKEAAEELNLLRNLISKVLLGKRNHTGGYHFEYYYI